MMGPVLVLVLFTISCSPVVSTGRVVTHVELDQEGALRVQRCRIIAERVGMWAELDELRFDDCKTDGGNDGI